MKSSDESEFLVGCTATTWFVNRVLRLAKLYQHRVHRLIEKQRLPAGSSSHRPVTIGVCLATARQPPRRGRCEITDGVS
jgi:hypothetical protein